MFIQIFKYLVLEKFMTSLKCFFAGVESCPWASQKKYLAEMINLQTSFKYFKIKTYNELKSLKKQKPLKTWRAQEALPLRIVFLK